MSHTCNEKIAKEVQKVAQELDTVVKTRVECNKSHKRKWTEHEKQFKEGLKKREKEIRELRDRLELAKKRLKAAHDDDNKKEKTCWKTWQGVFSKKRC